MSFEVGDRVAVVGTTNKGIIKKILYTTYGSFAVVQFGKRVKGLYTWFLVKLA